MKQILVMMTVVALVVGCSNDTRKATPDSAPPASKNIIADNIVDKAIRKELGKPISALTEADLEKVTSLDLEYTQITDAGLKDVTKLQKLGALFLYRTQVTEAGVAELKKALPNLAIYGP